MIVCIKDDCDDANLLHYIGCKALVVNADYLARVDEVQFLVQLMDDPDQQLLVSLVDLDFL